jgi:hypothetical protein
MSKPAAAMGAVVPGGGANPWRRAVITTCFSFGYIAFMLYRLPEDERVAAWDRMKTNVGGGLADFASDPLAHFNRSGSAVRGAASNTKASSRSPTHVLSSPAPSPNAPADIQPHQVSRHLHPFSATRTQVPREGGAGTDRDRAAPSSSTDDEAHEERWRRAQQEEKVGAMRELRTTTVCNTNTYGTATGVLRMGKAQGVVRGTI